MIEMAFLKELPWIEQVNQKFYICHYWYFLDKGFKFQPNVYHRCHDVLMMSINLNNFAVFNIRGVDYRCIINEISKSDAIKLLLNADLAKEKRVLKKQ